MGDSHMTDVDVSVIIVNWNTRGLLLKCLETIYEGTRTVSFEVIVVDNASSDGSAAAVREQFPAVTLIANDDNLGFSKANNAGIRVSRGRYVCLVNSDVEVHDGCLDELCAFMDADPSVGVVGPRVVSPDGSMQSTCRKLPSLWNNFCPAVGLNKLFPGVPWLSGEHMFYFPHDRRREVDVLVGCFLMARRPAVTEVGLLDEQFFIYGEDIDWCRRFGTSGWKVTFYPGAGAMHRGRSSSSSDPERFSIEGLRANRQYWAKHHNAFENGVMWCILMLHHGARLMAVNTRGLVARDGNLEARAAKHRTAIKWLVEHRAVAHQ